MKNFNNNNNNNRVARTSVDQNQDLDRGPEVIRGHVLEAILTVVPADLDLEALQDLDLGQGLDLDLTHQTFQSDVALHRF